MTQTPMRIDVLIWLPSETEPAFAGQILSNKMGASFRYDPGYLGHKKAISIYGNDLKMNMHRLDMGAAGVIAPSLRDALPDRWGRRAIAAGLNVSGGAPLSEDQISDLTLMLHTGPDRIGAFDFRLADQAPPVESGDGATLEELMDLADLIEEGGAVPTDLGHLIPQVASVGGARPKSLFTDTKKRRKFIAKFTAMNDTYPVVATEFVAMRLAAYAGINVASVEIAKIGQREVLLVERFDRTALPTGGWGRKAMVSALTWTHETELSAHHISYQQLAETITDGFEEAAVAHKELFTRLAFNILVGNTDDHARNHAAFWDGATHELTPAYDIAPQRRASREANQAMVISDGSRASQLRNASAVAHHFGLSESMTCQIYDRLIAAIMDNWAEVCDEAGLTRYESDTLAGRQFLNAYAFDGQRSVPRLP